MGFNSVCGRLLRITHATPQFKADFYAVNKHEVTALTERDTQMDTPRSQR